MKDWKNFLGYALPAVMGMLVTSLNIIIDGIFIGQGIGTDGLAAINLTYPFLGIVFGTGVMIGIGSGTIAGINLGKRNVEEANNVFSFSCMLAITISVICSVFSYALMTPLVNLLSGGALTNYVEDYLSVYMPFLPMIMLFILFDNFVRNDGSPKFAMMCTIAGALTNIVLDYLFIIILDYKLTGAAFATGIANSTSALLLLYYILKKSNNFSFVKPRWQKGLLSKILYNGSSEFLNEISAGVVTFIFNQILLSSVGELGVAAYSILGYIGIIVLMILIGIAIGLQPLVSFNYGAKNHDLLYKYLRMAITVAVVVSFSGYAVIFLFSNEIVSLFVKGNPGLVLFTTKAAKIFFLGFLLAGINLMISAYFTSIGDAKRSALISICRGLVFIVAFAMILPPFFGIDALWFSLPLTEILTLAIAWSLIKKSKRRVMMKLSPEPELS